jgi:hypothetical protein
MTTAARLAAIRPRLEKLVLMLSSPEPGEVFNAAKAIERTLQTAGADWHDLARELAAHQPLPSPTSEPRAPPHRPAGDWQAMHEFCRSRPDQLSKRECEFMDTLEHWHGTLTDKQQAWLVAIHARLRRT